MSEPGSVSKKFHDAYEEIVDLRERLAEAVSKLAYWHNSCADGDTFCGPCISGSPCATAAFLAKEKEKG